MITRDDCATMPYGTSEQTVTLAYDAELSIKQVCRMLNVERHTVYKMIESEVLPAVRVNPRVIRIPVSAVHRIVNRSDQT